MTAPRQYLSGTTYFVTRRCFERRFFLNPSKQTNQILGYLLAVIAARHEIQLHVYCFMSNHYHLVVTDPQARLPEFLRDFNGLVARALNASLGRREDFWAAEGHSAIALQTTADVVDKAAYALANPVAARLVRVARQWPGLWSPPETVGEAPEEVKRPRRFFDPEGLLPDTAHLGLVAPPGFESAASFAGAVAEALAVREAEGNRSATRFLGVLKVLSLRPTDQPRRQEPTRQLRPKVAARDPIIRLAALARLERFLRDYRQAMADWRAGLDAMFPEGTYLMRVLHGASCVTG